MFHVGQKVTLRNNRPFISARTHKTNDIGPVFGFVYEIKGIEKTDYRYVDDNQEIIVLVFAEWPNTGFDSNDFRPVRTTSIAVFEQILKSVPAPRERERA